MILFETASEVALFKQVDVDPTLKRFQVVMSAACLHGAIGHGIAFCAFYALDITLMAYFNLFFSIPCFFVAWVVNRNGALNSAYFLCFIEMYLHQVVGIALLGWASGLQFFLVVLAGLAFFNVMLSVRLQIASFVLVMTTFLILYLFFHTPNTVIVGERQYQFVFVAVTCAATLKLALVIRYFVRMAYLVERDLLSNQARLDRLVHTDHLTKLLNRRAFSEIASQVYVETKSLGMSLTALMIDIDKFKNINDKYGHDIGDKLLVEVARTLKTQLRSRDYVARYGGEEFAVLLPDTKRETGELVAEKLRQAIERIELKTTDNKIVKVTISLGGAVLSHGVPDFEALLKQADVNLYKAKTAGRNQYCF